MWTCHFESLDGKHHVSFESKAVWNIVFNHGGRHEHYMTEYGPGWVNIDWD